MIAHSYLGFTSTYKPTPAQIPQFKIGKEIELMNGEIIKGKFVEYSGDHSVEKNHSKIDKKTGEISNSSNGRLYVAA